LKENDKRKLIRVSCYNGCDKIFDEIDLEELDGKIQSCIIGGVYSWEKRYNDVIEFIEENERRPSNKSNNITEISLIQWIYIQKNNYKKNKNSMRDKTKREQWEKLNKDYKEYMLDNNEQWYNNYNESIQFMKDNEKSPSSKSKNIIEKQLGNWIAMQKKNYIKNKQAMQDETKREQWKKINEDYKKYLLTDDEIWNNNYNKSIQFMKDNKKRPSRTSKDIIEKKLAIWILTQKTNYSIKIKSMKDETKKKTMGKTK
jgi:hypothetical protein